MYIFCELYTDTHIYYHFAIPTLYVWEEKTFHGLEKICRIGIHKGKKPFALLWVETSFYVENIGGIKFEFLWKVLGTH